MTSYYFNLNCQNTTLDMDQRKAGERHPVLSFSLSKLCVYLIAPGRRALLCKKKKCIKSSTSSGLFWSFRPQESRPVLSPASVMAQEASRALLHPGPPEHLSLAESLPEPPLRVPSDTSSAREIVGLVVCRCSIDILKIWGVGFF